MFIRGVDFEEYRRQTTLGRVYCRGRSSGRMIGELWLCCSFEVLRDGDVRTKATISEDDRG